MKKALLLLALCAPLYAAAQTPAASHQTVTLFSGAQMEVYTMADVQASFISEVSSYLANKLFYPESARNANQQGKVFVRFIVDAEGRVLDPTVLKSSGHQALDNEALRVVGEMPAWKPAQVGGKPVATFFTLPIMFQLS